MEGLEEEAGVPVEVATDDGMLVEPTYEAWYGVPTMPRVNLSHPEARGYFLDVAAYWLREHGLDGWRMDVARYVDADFWVDFRRVCRQVKPDCYLLAEIMGDASPWLQGDRFDATMNYTFRDLCLGYFATRELGTGAFLDGFTRMLAAYAPEVTEVNQNLLSSHDTERFLHMAGDERARLGPGRPVPAHRSRGPGPLLRRRGGDERRGGTGVARRFPLAPAGGLGPRPAGRWCGPWRACAGPIPPCAGGIGGSGGKETKPSPSRGASRARRPWCWSIGAPPSPRWRCRCRARRPGCSGARAGPGGKGTP